MRGAVNVVADADSIQDAEVGYPAASSLSSWAVTSSSGIIIVREVEEDIKAVFALRIGRVHSGDIMVFDERGVVVG